MNTPRPAPTLIQRFRCWVLGHSYRSVPNNVEQTTAILTRVFGHDPWRYTTPCAYGSHWQCTWCGDELI